MAVTAAGTPYVESSDNVADYPGVSLALANHIDATAGKVLQVVSAISTTPFTTTSSTFVDVTDVSLSITPSATTSKVFVIVTGVAGNSDTNKLTFLNLVRDSTPIAQSTGGVTNSSLAVYTNSAVGNSGFAQHIVDSPNTTSATTYKLQIKSSGGTAMVGRNASSANNPSPTIITVFEVAA